MYTIDEIITSISDKPFRTGFSDAESDSVDPRKHLMHLCGHTDVRIRTTRVPISALCVLQPDIEMWRYVRLCRLSPKQFHELLAREPIIVVRGRMIHGYPLLQGNRRALYALMHGIESLPTRVCLLTEEEAAFSFICSAQEQYRNLDTKFGSHDVVALREAYKRLLTEVVHLRKRHLVFMRGEGLFSTRTALYRKLRCENEKVSEKIPCISLEGYLQTLKKTFHIRRDSLRLSVESIFYRGLMMTQSAIEHEKLQRVARSPRLLQAPILIARTRMLDYVAVGHTRLRAHIENLEPRCQAICIHVEDDALNRFLNTQAHGAGYLSGNEGIRRMEII